MSAKKKDNEDSVVIFKQELGQSKDDACCDSYGSDSYVTGMDTFCFNESLEYWQM